jgi:fused signal recognition particle receptor
MKKETIDKGLEKSKSTFFSKLSKAVAGKSKVNDDVLDAWRKHFHSDVEC